MKKTKITLYLPPELYAKLKEAIYNDGWITISSWFNDVAEITVEENDKKRH